MALFKEQKSQIIKSFRRSELDTGSSEVQIALLTSRILELTGHFKKNKHDVHSRRGLLRMVNRRRKLLDYIKKHDRPKYQSVISELGIRK